MQLFTKVELYTDNQGFAQFREEAVELSEGSPRATTIGDTDPIVT